MQASGFQPQSAGAALGSIAHLGGDGAIGARQLLGEDGERLLWRVWRVADGYSPALRARGTPRPRSIPRRNFIDRLTHEAGLRGSLGIGNGRRGRSNWSRSMAGPRSCSRMAAASRSSACSAGPWSCSASSLSPSASPSRSAISAPARPRRTRTSSRPTFCVDCADRPCPPHRLRALLAAASGTAGRRGLRVPECRHARLYGAGADRADEPVDRFSQRSLRRWASRSTGC